jgi:hypothetical protein
MLLFVSKFPLEFIVPPLRRVESLFSSKRALSNLMAEPGRQRQPAPTRAATGQAALVAERRPGRGPGRQLANYRFFKINYIIILIIYYLFIYSN